MFSVHSRVVFGPATEPPQNLQEPQPLIYPASETSNESRQIWLLQSAPAATKLTTLQFEGEGLLQKAHY